MFQTNLPAHLKTLYDRITTSTSPKFKLVVKFVLPDGTVLPVDTKYIQSLEIYHEFHESICPLHRLSLSIPSDAAMVLLANHQDLTVYIEQYVDIEGRLPTLLKKQTFFAIIEDLPDVVTTLHEAPSDLGTSPEDVQLVSLTMELETVFNYKLTKTRTAFQLRDATVEDALHFASAVFGFSTVNIEKPDNLTQYTNLDLSQNMSLMQICEKLQNSEAYDGVYYGDISMYVMDEVLYVQPKYLAPSSTKDATFFIMTDPDGGPVNGTTIMEGSGPKVIVTDPVKTASDFKMAAEQANAFQVIDPVKIWDAEYTATDSGVQAPKIADLVTLTDVGGVTSEGFTHVISPSRNIANSYTRLRLNTLSQTDLIWRNAVPDSITPDMAINLTMVNESNFITKRGVINGARFLLTRDAGLETHPTFTCTGTLTVYTAVS